MDKVYDHSRWEQEIYLKWEAEKCFYADAKSPKKPYTIILPLPNANASMHVGHALFTVQDILVRYHRMLGDNALYVPGGDHAGIETQFVFEKVLAKEGKSRFNYDRETFFSMVADYVEQNKNLNKDQMKLLGLSLDWTRYKYSLDADILEKVFATFRALNEDGLIYRSSRMTQYCTKCGTSYSDLEVEHEEKEDKLYFLDYGIVTIATARPETIFADVAVAVNPNDSRHEKLAGKNAVIPLSNKEIPLITDAAVSIEFGTGALKVTPAHDPLDYEIGQRHKLAVIECVSLEGKLKNVPPEYLGLKVLPAREKVVEDLEKAGKLVKTISHTHSVAVCYRCRTTIEPMLMPQWYLTTKPLAEKALEAVKSGKTKIVPDERFEKMYYEWLENITDWNISRQIIWGPRIPAWYCLDCSPQIHLTFINKDKNRVSGTYAQLKSEYSLEEIESGLQSLSAGIDSKYFLDKNDKCPSCGGNHLIQETDTFDTWFLSGQWPMNVLGYPNSDDFKTFYPTDVLDTLWDILFFWVARMMMLGIYRTGEVPFKTIHLHARVVDKFGKKMSKSKGNVVDPVELISKYGADALRMALVFGVAPAGDIALSEEKVRAMRNFANKIWNMGRFLEIEMQGESAKASSTGEKLEEDIKIIAETDSLTEKVTTAIEKYRFSDAAEAIYAFMWDRLASQYLEEIKAREGEAKTAGLDTFRYAYLTCIKLLHPFMPFVTEVIWNTFSGSKQMLAVSSWPSTNLIRIGDPDSLLK